MFLVDAREEKVLRIIIFHHEQQVNTSLNGGTLVQVLSGLSHGSLKVDKEHRHSNVEISVN